MSRWLDLARRTLDGLLVDGERGYWTDDAGEAAPWLYHGTAGVSLVLVLGYEVTGDARYLAGAQRGAEWLEAGAGPGERGPYPGLFVGEAGLGALFLRLARASGDAQWLERAAARARWAARQPPRMTELLYGAAGLGLFLLDLYATTGAVEWLGSARAQGRYLEQVGVQDVGVKWSWEPGSPRRGDRFYPGLAHGGAGIAIFLLELARADPSGPWAALGRQALRWLEATAVVHADAASWPYVPGEGGEHPLQWCHGAPGIGLAFVRAGGADDLIWARRAARATLAAGDARGNPSHCHGLAGNWDLLVELSRVSGESRWRQAALELAEGLTVYAREEGGALRWSSDEAGVTRPAFATGSAGVAYGLLRLEASGALGLPLLSVG